MFGNSLPASSAAILLFNNNSHRALKPALTMFVPCSPKNQKNEINNTYSNAIPSPAPSISENVMNG